VINSNLGPISHRFQDMAIFRLKKRTFSLYPPPLNPEQHSCSVSKRSAWRYCQQVFKGKLYFISSICTRNVIYSKKSNLHDSFPLIKYIELQKFLNAPRSYLCCVYSQRFSERSSRWRAHWSAAAEATSQAETRRTAIKHRSAHTSRHTGITVQSPL